MKTKKIILNTAFFLLSAVNFTFAQNISAEKNWETEGFKNPESVVIDQKNNVLYVSNVNGVPTDKDNNGFISKVSKDGKIIKSNWIEGLNAPKGLRIFGNKLYVTDIDEIVVIDINKNKIEKKYKAEGATFLNDIAVANDGAVYATNTFGFSGIFRLKNDKVTLWHKSDDLQMPNGILANGNNLIIAPWGIDFNPENYQTKTPGSILSISTKDKTVKLISKPIGNLDGIEKNGNDYIITDWLAGKLFYFSNGTTTELVDLPQGSADLAYDAKSKTAFIPLMNDNKIVAYKIKK